jgi:hypothetical protein
VQAYFGVKISKQKYVMALITEYKCLLAKQTICFGKEPSEKRRVIIYSCFHFSIYVFSYLIIYVIIYLFVYSLFNDDTESQTFASNDEMIRVRGLI